jgi:hypothetical protein
MSKTIITKIKSHEVAVKTVTSILIIVGMIYVGFASELLKGRIPEIHRLILCVFFIYGTFRLASDMPLIIYKKLFK